MAKFLPEGSLYTFVGIVSVLFTMMVGCFLYHKGKPYCTKPIFKKLWRKKGHNPVKRLTHRNKFLMKRGEKADADEEGGAAENEMDKVRAEIDAKYNNPNPVWTTIASGGT